MKAQKQYQELMYPTSSKKILEIIILQMVQELKKNPGITIPSDYIDKLITNVNMKDEEFDKQIDSIVENSTITIILEDEKIFVKNGRIFSIALALITCFKDDILFFCKRYQNFLSSFEEAKIMKTAVSNGILVAAFEYDMNSRIDFEIYAKWWLFAFAFLQQVCNDKTFENYVCNPDINNKIYDIIYNGEKMGIDFRDNEAYASFLEEIYNVNKSLIRRNKKNEQKRNVKRKVRLY